MSELSGRNEPTQPVTAERELPHSVSDDAELTEGQRAEAADVIESIVEVRRNKANRATRGVLAALLCLEAIVVLLVPRAIAQTSTGLDGTKTGILIALAVVLVACGFLLTRPWGIGLGSVLQVAVVVTGVLTLVMLFIGLIFVAIWLWVLTMRRDLVGTPGGLKMLVS
ncbi:MAG: hypothetical protein JWM76_302 [Pseudonocardiales bacterium]|nr:hypothetical protein [Pseudonocardiales bacterium]